MPSHDPTDVEIILNDKPCFLRSTPLAMRGISQLCGGYQGALTGLIQHNVETAITLIAFGLNRTKPRDTEAINEMIYKAGGVSAIYSQLEEYLLRVFHGGKLPAKAGAGEDDDGDLGGGEGGENPTQP